MTFDNKHFAHCPSSNKGNLSTSRSNAAAARPKSKRKSAKATDNNNNASEVRRKIEEILEKRSYRQMLGETFYETRDFE